MSCVKRKKQRQALDQQQGMRMSLNVLPDRLQGFCHVTFHRQFGDAKLFCNLVVIKIAVPAQLKDHPLLARQLLQRLVNKLSCLGQQNALFRKCRSINHKLFEVIGKWPLKGFLPQLVVNMVFGHGK